MGDITSHMGQAFFTGSGRQVQAGRELGKGGEGSVFEHQANPHQVIKLYHARHLPDKDKQAKLRHMASVADRELLNYAAWPLDTLHKTKGGPVIGFTMQKVSNYSPIHMLYSPAQRKQNHPKLSWEFLLHLARNTAAAFASIHRHGHIIGDVNQGNVLAGTDSKVILIDCDSFQINVKGKVYPCGVGVSHFTPPELQNASTFNGVRREANHDNFGLALLIFHILFGGRHPYSGKALRKDVGESLEADIKGFRFAYARDAKRRDIEPPPMPVPIDIAPDIIRYMFENAFTEPGAAGRRPTAAQWVTELDHLRRSLAVCGKHSIHVYPDHLRACPWCGLEREGISYFPVV